MMAGLMLAITNAQGATLPADTFPTFESYLKVSGQAASVSGNGAAFQKRHQQRKNGGAGIEELRYSKDLEKDVTMEIDGRALFGAEDYLGKLKFSKNEVGSFEVGYKSFRTFYDGIGGFFPLNKQWNALTPEALHLDRGEFWVEAKLARPDQPEFELKYTDGFRRGQKDATVWGDSDFTGLPNNTPPLSPARKMIPSYRDLDETHKTLEGSMKYKAGNTLLYLALLSEKTDDLDTRYGMRFPGEIKPFPTPAATVLVPAASMNNQVRYSQTDGMETKLFGVTAKSDTAFTEKVSVKVGINYQDLDSAFTGDRPLYTSTPTAVGVVIVPSNNYLNLAGGSQVKIYVGNIAFDWKPTKESFVQLALRGEDKYTKSVGSLTSVSSSVSTTTGVVTTTNTDQIFNSRVKEKSLTPALELRYTGIKNVALYATASVRNVDGDERYVTPYNPVSPPTGNATNRAMNTMTEDRTRITVGANWQAAKYLTLRGEVFHKDNTNRAVGYLARSDGFVDRYDLGYKYNGFKLTVIAKPVSVLSFTTRYIYQSGKATVTGISVTGNGSVATPYVADYPEYDSMNMSNHMISETIDWSPSSQFYMQANLNVVFNVIGTVYPRAGVVPASGSNLSWDANQVLQNSNNNYITASLLAGAVLTKRDDLQFQYTHYRADNYDGQLAIRTMPYGAGAKESIVTVGLKHKFSDRCLGNFKLGYCDSKNDTTGGNTDFRGPLGYVSFEYAL